MKTAIKILTVAILLAYIIFFPSCRIPKGTKYAVRKTEHVKGRTWMVTTDSFSRLVRVKGGPLFGGKYSPDSIRIPR